MYASRSSFYWQLVSTAGSSLYIHIRQYIHQNIVYVTSSKIGGTLFSQARALCVLGALLFCARSDKKQSTNETNGRWLDVTLCVKNDLLFAGAIAWQPHKNSWNQGRKSGATPTIQVANLPSSALPLLCSPRISLGLILVSCTSSSKNVIKQIVTLVTDCCFL